MKITILNGNPNPHNTAFDDYVTRLTERLTAEYHGVTIFPLRKLDIKYCTGCWGCWVKTPGECVVPDDSRDVCRAVINSAVVVFASPVIMGFVSALLKKTTDKLIPLIHPYIDVVQHEAHHRARYDHYPTCGLLLGPDAETDTEDLAIIADIYSRTSLNFKSVLAFTRLTSDPIAEVTHEINRL